MVLSPGTGLGNILFVAVYNTARSDLLVWPALEWAAWVRCTLWASGAQ